MTRENFKSILLVILALLSMFLSYNLWTYQTQFNVTGHFTDSVALEDSYQRGVVDVIQPSFAVYHAVDGHFKGVNTEPLTELLGQATIENISRVSRNMSMSELHDFILEDRKIELVYPLEMPMNVFRKLFSIDTSMFDETPINRIILPMGEYTGDLVEIYFVSLEQGVVLQGTVRDISTGELETVASDLAAENKSVMPYELATNRIVYLPTDRVEMQKKELLADVIDVEIFKQALFLAGTSLTSEKEGTITSYTDAIRLLTIDASTGELSFQDLSAVPTENQMPINDLVVRSIDFINGHNGWTNSYNLADWDEENNQVLFRMVKGGIPVFNGATIVQHWGKEGIISYDRSSYKFDEFLSQAQEVQVVLPSGNEIIEAIEELEIVNREDVEDIFIAYEMRFVEGATSDFATRYLQLVPIWSVKVNGTYYRLGLKNDGSIGGSLIGLE